MRDFHLDFGSEEHLAFDPMDDVLRDGNTSRLLHERAEAAKGRSYTVSETHLSGFIAWAATEIVSFHHEDHTKEYLYTILPTLIRLRALLRVLQAHPRFALSLEKFFYEEGLAERKWRSAHLNGETENNWKIMIASIHHTEEERRQDSTLISYLSRLMARLRKQFQDHPYRSYEQSIYSLLDPRTLAVRYVGMAHDVRRRYRRHLENRDGTQMKKEWIGGLLVENLVPHLEYLERGPETSYYAEEREFRWIRYHLQIRSPLTNIEASYPHLVQVCQSTSIDFLTEPLSIVNPSPVWWPIFVAQAQDEMDRSVTASEAKRVKGEER